MKSIDEKEKKLNQLLQQLKNLKLVNDEENNYIKDLEKQKNQLVIEKKEVEEQYTFILKENQELKKLKLDLLLLAKHRKDCVLNVTGEI